MSGGRDAGTFLGEKGGGEGYEAVKFLAPNDAVVGTIMREPKTVMRKNLNDGSPEEQLPVNLETADGPRTLWVRGGFLAGAIGDAIKASGATGLQQGGQLAVRFTETRDTGKPQPAKVFEAVYTPPKTGGADVDAIFANKAGAPSGEGY